MGRNVMQERHSKNRISRRKFLEGLRWSPVLFLPAPLYALAPHNLVPRIPLEPWRNDSFAFADLRFSPHYPAKSPLEPILALAAPGGDEYVTEKYAFEIARLLAAWGDAFKKSAPALDLLATFLNVGIDSHSLAPVEETAISRRYGIEVLRRRFGTERISGREPFLDDLRRSFASFSQVRVAHFEITRIEQLTSSPLTVAADIRYELAGTGVPGHEQRMGTWRTRWQRDPSGAWQAIAWRFGEENVSRSRGPIFLDVTSQLLGQLESYKQQMLRGVDHWRTVLDGACGIDIYGNNGVAAGDFDGDGFDDIYVCQPAGLPNRLYRNRGDGTFEDVTESSGVGVLDATACALFADFENKGKQDLLVVCGSGPLLFVNRGNGKFELKNHAFRFDPLPQGTFTHAAIADYDRDGRLDVYFCVYSYYLGLDQYHYPAPYFDARNGPPNFLFHNEGDGTFRDRTQAAGLNADNDRYSFACAWGDYDGDGWPDLYVANDFGRGNLYRNNGDGSFSSVAAQAGVDEVGAGMSACWFDFDGDGKQDIYVGNMWSAAGLRISEQKPFHEGEPDDIRNFYRRHARGNSLYKNLGNGKFESAGSQAGVGMGRWSWASDTWDFDHDGYPDLYVTNGYISGPNAPDLASFFWRQVVSKSPQTATPSPAYETGWNAINELIRSDGCWNGRERNVFYSNNRDGTFADISALSGLDLPDDSRAFALADLDHDGRPEVILKNRTAPQIRILRNVMKEVGNSVAFRLRGTRSNRDAIGAAVTLQCGGSPQTKYLQAGSGFLSQHSKELFFGLGKWERPVRATVRWPNGLTQTFEDLPVNHRITIEEGLKTFAAQPYAEMRWTKAPEDQNTQFEPPSEPETVETWLIEPLTPPNFALPDVNGYVWNLDKFQGTFLLLSFWTVASERAAGQLRSFQQRQSQFAPASLQLAAVNVNAPEDAAAVRSFLAAEDFRLPVLLGTPETAGVYNILYRYLFDRHTDLPLPISFLVDKERTIVKVYQGPVSPERLQQNLKLVPRTPADRASLALPFPGKLYLGEFQRNDFTYGVALFQRGYLDQAADSFRQVIARKPDSPEAYYNLGTLYLRRNMPQQALENLESAVKLRPNYPEAWNNLGMLAAQQGRADQAIQNFKQSLLLKPDYAVALANLGNVYRRQKSFKEAEDFLGRALKLEPNDPEINYGMGMLYAQQRRSANAEQYLQKAVSLRPDYPDALNNLGVLFAGERRYAEAEGQFKTCIQFAPNFEQAYLNLARLYVVMNDREKAKDVLESLLRLQPQNAMAKQTLEMLN